MDMRTNIYKIAGIDVECDSDRDVDLVTVIGNKGTKQYRFSDPVWDNWIKENLFNNRRAVFMMITAYTKNTGVRPDRVECGAIEVEGNMNSAEVKNEEKRLLREWLALSASMVVVDGKHGLPARKKALEAKTREAVGEPVPNFT